MKVVLPTFILNKRFKYETLDIVFSRNITG